MVVAVCVRGVSRSACSVAPGGDGRRPAIRGQLAVVEDSGDIGVGGIRRQGEVTCARERIVDDRAAKRPCRLVRSVEERPW